MASVGLYTKDGYSKRMQRISHAGWGGQYVENTIPSLRRSIQHVDMIEIDLHRCRSGEVVLFHDDTLERVADDPRNIEQVTLDELRNVSLFGTDETIPTLEEAFETIPSNVGLNLEFKESGLAAPVRELAAEYDHDLVISSFHEEAIRDVNRFEWDVATGYLFEEGKTTGIQSALALDCEFVHPHYECCLDSDLVSRARRSGLSVNVWTITEISVMEALEDLGVDGVIIDCEEVFGSEEL